MYEIDPDERKNVLSNPTSFTEVSRVIESYHKWRVFPTSHCFPYASPFLPALALSPLGQIKFLTELPAFFMNVIRDFESSRRFLEASEFSQKTLPRQTRDYLWRRFKNYNGIFKFKEDDYNVDPRFEKCKEVFGEILEEDTTVERKQEFLHFTERLLKSANELEIRSWYDLPN